jgi:cholesterol 24(S)-hydroxylase
MTDDFVTFFVAGQETTANTLAFVFLELGRRPDLVVKAREEIDRILGVRTNVTFQNFNELKYCSAIFKEALRLYPPAMTYERFSTEVMDVNGYEIPEKTILTVIFLFLLIYYDKN